MLLRSNSREDDWLNVALGCLLGGSTGSCWPFLAFFGLRFEYDSIIFDDGISQELNDDNDDLQAALSDRQSIIELLLRFRLLLKLLVARTGVASALILVLFKQISVALAAVLALDQLQLLPFHIDVFDRLKDGLHYLVVAEDRHDIADAFLLAFAVLDHQGRAVEGEEARLPVPPVV